ncbi:adhesion G- coupled receptor G7-like, partial [Paramuricea clavata]
SILHMKYLSLLEMIVTVLVKRVLFRSQHLKRVILRSQLHLKSFSIFSAGNDYGFGEESNFTSFSTSEGPCASENVGTLEAYGIFMWPDTRVGHRSTLACPYNNESIATRECWHTTQTDSGSVWGPTDVTQCEYKDKRSKGLFLLVQKEVNVSNVAETTQEIKSLSSDGQTLEAGDISNIATVLEKIVSVKQKANEISEDFFATIDNVLDARTKNVLRSQQNTNSSSRILKAIDNFAEILVVNSGKKIETVNRHFAITLQVVQPQTFTGLTFSAIVGKSHELKKNSISTKSTDSVPTGSSASISIPRTIFNESTIRNSSTQESVIFALYKETKFFAVSLVDTSENSRRLNSFVIAGSIKGLPIANLSKPVKIALRSIARGDTNSALCSYWDFGRGNWSQEGCRFERVLRDGRILCNCDHLTNFAILMDINPGILTIITILILRGNMEQRSKIPGQILLNFCIALSLSLIVFVAAAERSKTSSLVGCRIAAISLHYFLLAAFFWMATEAFNMYLAFVKVFPSSNHSKFMMKCCLFAWGKDL